MSLRVGRKPQPCQESSCGENQGAPLSKRHVNLQSAVRVPVEVHLSYSGTIAYTSIRSFLSSGEEQ